MAERGSRLLTFLSKIIVLLLITLLVFSYILPVTTEHVHEFVKREITLNEKVRHEADSSVRQKRTTTVDDVCIEQQKTHLKDYGLDGQVKTDDAKKIGNTHTFENDSNSALAITWAGNDDVLIIVTTTDNSLYGGNGASTVYRSVDNGKTFKNISDKIDNAFIRKSGGLQRNTHTPSKVYLISPTGNNHNLYFSEDGGLTFFKSSLPFVLDGTFIYHPRHDDWFLARSGGYNKNLYVTTDNGRHWKQIKTDIHDVKWATPESQTDWESCIYVTSNDKGSKHKSVGFVQVTPVKILEKTCNKGDSWSKILTDVYSFGIEGKFLYASVVGKESNEKVMNVSTNGGDTWAIAKLPTIIHGQFYSILDMSEGLVFIHVDKPGDSGFGDLYMSSGKGIIFSESLTRHLYPNFGEITDFYPVKSLRGVYITSQMLEDKSIQSMISYNRGASWSTITRPKGVPCKDESKACNLQLHNSYSLSRAILADPPKSEASAVGIILAHGHIAEALQTTNPDVFVSDDGGYEWRFALKGPHMYQIADSGGLLVALEKKSNHQANKLKFSLDEGRCWHEYQFSDQMVAVTGLLTEPGSKSAAVGIWGFGSVDKKWRVYTVDFTKVVTERCSESHYQKWQAHSEHRANEKGDMSGCLLGVRETFSRLKKDSWCINGYGFTPPSTKHVCTCTREDFECDYSYYRPVGKDDCIKQDGFKASEEIKVCLRGHEEEIITKGYRKIPGDNCTGKVDLGDEIIDLHEKCDSNKELMEELKPKDKITIANDEASSHKYVVFIILGLAAGVLFIFLAGVFIYRFYFTNKHVMNYRYSLLHHSEERDFDGEFESALTTASHKFEDSEDEQLSRKNTPKQNGKVDRYHDDSDVEMLE